MKRELDIVVLSDVHLGTYGCHAKELLTYLKSIQPEILILNGDFMHTDLKKKSHFPDIHIKVLQRILKMATNGSKVYYITGNHDDHLRRYSNFSTGNIHLRDKLVLQLNGKKVWVFHGDIFDILTKYSPLVGKLGGKGYDWLIRFNRFVNKWRVKLGRNQMSYAGSIKSNIKKAEKYIQDFENTAINLAFEHGYDYVICGHIHQPKKKTVQRKGHSVCYMNSGDWVENLTALEYAYGEWNLYEYDQTDFEYVNKKLIVNDSKANTKGDKAPLGQEAFMQRFFDEIDNDDPVGILRKE